MGFTPRESDIAMENGPFIDDLPIEICGNLKLQEGTSQPAILGHSHSK